MALVERSTSYRIVCNIGKRERHIDREPVLRNSPIHSLGLFANDGSIVAKVRAARGILDGVAVVCVHVGAGAVSARDDVGNSHRAVAES